MPTPTRPIQTADLTAVERIKSSLNGNARYLLTMTDGATYRTAPDSSYADTVHRLSRMLTESTPTVPVRFTIDGRGNIASIYDATPAPAPKMIGYDQARAELAAIGVTPEQMDQVTGFGLRRLAQCKADDSILEKYRAHALTASGVMMVLYGLDSPEHHAGRTLAEQVAR